MYKFQFGTYKTWRSFWIFVGIFWIAFIYSMLVKGKNMTEYPIWGTTLILGVTFMAPIGRYFLYQSVSNSTVIFNYILFKKKIPIKDIYELSYEQRPAWRYLVIKYTDEKGNERQKEWSVDFNDPIDIRKLNDKLTKINSNIEIKFDEEFTKFMEEKKDLHKKAPTSAIGWIWFALKWGGITAMLNFGLLEFIRHVDPSVFK